MRVHDGESGVARKGACFNRSQAGGQGEGGGAEGYLDCFPSDPEGFISRIALSDAGNLPFKLCVGIPSAERAAGLFRRVQLDRAAFDRVFCGIRDALRQRAAVQFVADGVLDRRPDRIQGHVGGRCHRRAVGIRSRAVCRRRPAGEIITIPGECAGGQRCACFKKKAIELIYNDSNLKNITEGISFDSFDLSLYSDDVRDDTGKSPHAYAGEALSAANRRFAPFLPV